MEEGRSSRRSLRILGALLLLAGFVLLALPLSWYVHPLPSPYEHKDDRGSPIASPPADVAPLRSQDDLVAAILRDHPRTPREIARRAHDLVAARFDTCYDSRFTFQQNWMIALVGLVWPKLAFHNGTNLVRYSSCGLCSQTNGTMVLALARLGVNARLVNMPGHTPAEVEWDGRWHLVDPHYGFFPDESEDDIDVLTVARNPELVTRLYGDLLTPTVLELTRQSYAAYGLDPKPPMPTGSSNEPVLLVLKNVAMILQWALPIGMLVLGGAILLRGARSGRSVFRFLLGALLALGAAELVVRQFHWAPTAWDPDFGPIQEPGERTIVSDEQRAVSRWTTGGIRRAAPPDPGRPAILALGDSFTEALMVNDEDVFTQRLEEALTADGLPYQVLNAGKSSASVADYVHLAPVYEERFDPRWTVVQLRESDLGADAWSDRRAHFRRAPDGLLEVVGAPREQNPLWTALHPLRTRSTLVQYGPVRALEFAAAFRREPPLFRAASAPVEELDEETAPQKRAYPILDELDLLNEAYGGRLTLLYVAPFDPAHLEAPATGAEADVMRHCRERGWSCVNTREAWPEFAARHEAPFGFPATGYNRGHLNAGGHHAAAALLAAEIERLSSEGRL